MRELVDSRGPFRRPSFFLYLYLAASVFYLVFTARTSFVIDGERTFTLLDDAMISMRYAEHWADGYGLVWNIGAPPIEGFTNLGWTAVLALIHLLPVAASRISLVVMVLGGVILVLNLHVIRRIAERVSPGSEFVPVVAVVATALCFPLVFWCLRGMEMGLLCLLVNTATLIALRLETGFGWRGILSLGLLTGILLTVRLDAGGQIAVLILFAVFHGSRRKEAPKVATVILIPAGFLLLLTLFRLQYFGELVPNTYFLKLTGVPLVERVLNGARMFFRFSFSRLDALVFLAAFGLFWQRSRMRSSLWLLVFLFLIPSLYSIYVGGDFAEFLVDGVNRFVTPGLGALFILCAIVLGWVFQAITGDRWQKDSRQTLLVAVGAGLCIVYLTCGWQWGRWTFQNAPMLSYDIWRTKLGLVINQGTAKDAVVAVHAAGQIPYYSRRPSIDLLGRSDRVVARVPPSGLTPGHNKWDYEYSILGLRPDVVADPFDKTESFLGAAGTGYERLENGVWVRIDSDLADRVVLSRAFR